MSENIIVILGSGASYASGYKVKIEEKENGKFFTDVIAPPTDCEFFKSIKDLTIICCFDKLFENGNLQKFLEA